jgi:hypothetical protein
MVAPLAVPTSENESVPFAPVREFDGKLAEFPTATLLSVTAA